MLHKEMVVQKNLVKLEYGRMMAETHFGEEVITKGETALQSISGRSKNPGRRQKKNNLDFSRGDK